MYQHLCRIAAAVAVTFALAHGVDSLAGPNHRTTVGADDPGSPPAQPQRSAAHTQERQPGVAVASATPRRRADE